MKIISANSFRAVLVSVALVASLAAHARTSVPVVDIVNAPVVLAPGVAPTRDKIKGAILRGASARKWSVDQESPDKVTLKLVVRDKHTVFVDVVYSPTSYSVVYRNSINMNYKVDPDGKPVIHPFYERWIQDLNESIRLELLKA